MNKTGEYLMNYLNLEQMNSAENKRRMQAAIVKFFACSQSAAVACFGRNF